MIDPNAPMDPLGDEPTPPRVMRSKGATTLLPVGTTVVIHAPHAPKWHGQVVTIIKVNPVKYKVETKTHGRVNVPHKMVKEV